MTPEKLIVFLVNLCVLVVLHELGHFIVARWNGVRVTDFAVGFGPTLLKWTSKRSGTNYRLNLLPLGGYCQMKGEDGKTNEAEQQRQFRSDGYEPDNFQAKRPWQRLSIVLAGPVANFIVAIVLLIGAASVFGIPGDKPTTMVGQLVSGFPADRAGMRSGDRITAIDGRAMPDGNVLVDTIHHSLGRRIHVTYERDGVSHSIDLVPVGMPSAPKDGHLGFTPFPATHRVPIGEAVTYGWTFFSSSVQSTLGVLGALVTHPATVAGQVSGPIGIARVSAQVQDFGPAAFLTLSAMLSISLGIFNLLPIPALDGGRGAFIIVEMLRGRPVDPEKEALVHVGGFAVLIVLMLAVSYHDIASAIASTHKQV
jgi:regulator of sigma E protease